MNNRPICFDMDGVIIDSEPSHYEAFRLTFEPLGVTLSNNDYQKYFAGKTDEQGFIDFIDNLQHSFDVPALQSIKRNHYMALAGATVELYESTMEAIRQLALHHPLALVTSSPLSQVHAIFNRFSLHPFFPILVTAEDVVNGKPDPESYLLAANRLGCEPSNCFVVEDAPSGVLAAKRAGMHCVALTTTHTADQLTDADRVVERLSA